MQENDSCGKELTAQKN